MVSARRSADAEVTGTEYHDSRVTFDCRIPRRLTDGLDGDDVRVTIFDSQPAAALAAPAPGRRAS